MHAHRLVPLQPDALNDEAGHSSLGLTARISVPMKVLPWMRNNRAETIAQAVQRAVPDAIYALGHECWQAALDLAKHIERPAALNVWCADLLRQLPQGRAAESVSAYIAPTKPLVNALRELVDPDLVSYVPQGVAVPPEPLRVFADPDRTVTLAVIGSGNDLISYRAALSGLSRIITEGGNVHVFLELRGPQQHEIWRHANRLELLPYISAITDAAQFRSLITQCDMLIMPERIGEVRSLTLEAMGMGLPLVAARDSMLDMLIPDQTALVVDDAEPDAWFANIQKLVTSPDLAREIGLTGRRHVLEHHRSSDQVAALLETLGQIVHGGSIDFLAGPQ